MDLERKLVWSIISITCILSTLPIIVGYLTAGDNIFMGLPMGVSDVNTYFDLMNQAKQGHFFFINSYTSEPMPRLLISPIHWLMGILTIVLPQLLVWHGIRLLMIIAFCLLFYYIVSKITTTIAIRVIALFCVSLGSGLGAFITLWNTLGIKYFGSVDLWVPEAIPFLTMIRVPMYVYSLILMLASVYLFKEAYDQQNYKLLAAAILTANLLASEHIFDIAPLFLTCAGYMGYKYFREKTSVVTVIKWGVLYFGLSSIVPLYFVYIFFFVPAYQAWTAQNILSSPPITNYVFGLGIALYTAIFYIIVERKKVIENSYLSIFALWIMSTLFLLYFPVDFQRRFVEGLFIPLCVLSAYGIYHIAKQYHKIIAVALVVLLPITNIYMVFHLSEFNYDETSEFSAPFYLQQDQYNALQFLTTVDPQSIILADPKLSNYIPRISGHKVYVGHWTQTSNYEEKAMWYYNKNQFTKNELDSRNIDIVISSNAQPYLTPLASYGSLTIYTT